MEKPITSHVARVLYNNISNVRVMCSRCNMKKQEDYKVGQDANIKRKEGVKQDIKKYMKGNIEIIYWKKIKSYWKQGNLVKQLPLYDPTRKSPTK